MRHRILCFGGRNFYDTERIKIALDELYRSPGFESGFAIIHGGARGADSLCGEWGKSLGFCVVRVDANWDTYGKGAGTIRNAWMLEFCSPTYAVGFPGGTGTADMNRRLIAANVPVWAPYGLTP